MDITAVAVGEVLTSYVRQEKLAEARRNAESQMIKTAVAERVSLSQDARTLAIQPVSVLPTQTLAVMQSVPTTRHNGSAAREYSKNQPVSETEAEAVEEAEGAKAVSKSTTGQGKTGSQPTEAMQQVKVPAIPISTQSPQYPFRIPRELQVYISNLPKEQRPPVPQSEAGQKAA